MKNVLFATAIALLTVGFALPQEASAQLCNAEAHNWVDTHQADLPRTYADFSQFSLNYRRAIYSALDSRERSQLWQEQLERVLQRDDLTNLQRDVVLEAVQLATPELFATLKDLDNPGHQNALRRLKDFERRAGKAFGKDTGELFARLGPPDVEIGIIRPRGWEAIQKSTPLPPLPGCSCSTVSDYCSSAFHCASGNCILIRDECGTFWTYDCNGLCVTN